MSVRMMALTMVGTLALAGPAAAAAPITDAQATAIMTKGGCTICHSVDKKLVGPSYLEVSKKHKGDKTAPTALADKVRKGGMGVYGQIPMPPNAPDKISDADLKSLVEWILSK